MRRGKPPVSAASGQVAVQLPQFMHAVTSPPPYFAISRCSPGSMRTAMCSSSFP